MPEAIPRLAAEQTHQTSNTSRSHLDLELRLVFCYSSSALTMGTTKTRAPAKAANAAKVSPDVLSSHLPDRTFILDNGAYTMKAGYASTIASEEEALSACTTIPNALVKTRDNRIVVGTQLATHVSDWNEAMFRRPLEKGYIVNWEAQKEIWEQSFFEEKATARNKLLRISTPEETTLVLTEAPNALPALQRNTDEMVMEEWGFGGYVRCLGECDNTSVDFQCRVNSS